MHLGIEAVQLAGDRRGIGRYVRSVVSTMLAQQPTLSCTLFARDAVDAAVLAAGLRDWAGAGATRLRTAPVAALCRTPMDACWYPWNVIRWRPPDVPVVATIHDLVPMLFADTTWRRLFTAPRAARLLRATVARADAILANSDFTAGEIRRVLGPPRAPITVTPLAADACFAREPSPEAVAAADALALPAPFVLSVGAGDARKNLGLVLAAGRELARRGRPVTVAVLGPGRKLRTTLARTAAPWLVAPGFVPDEVLAVLYARATALVFPSRYEGFGLPVLEAMTAGCPVVTTRLAAMPEVAGDAACYVGADDAAALADAIERLRSGETYRARLVEAGRARARDFSWDETARRTWKVLAGLG